MARPSHGMLTVSIIALAFLTAPAHAQDAPQPPSTVQDASADWQMMLRAQAHVAKSVSALAQENEKLKAEIARRDAEGKKAEKPN